VPSASRPISEAPRPAAARPEDYVRRILVADDFPALSRKMGELMASLQEGEASAQRLANLVLRDYALTVKVIRTANTVHYNRTGRPVQSATHAMMLLGAQTVRDLASALLLFEQYRGRSPGLKELMLLSLLTAGHAREMAARLGMADPESAQLCGMFRNLGEVLTAAHLPSENAAILRLSAERAAGRDARRARESAASSVLGCSLEDIGVAIAGDWGMPASVCRGMRATGERSEEPLELVTAFAHDLTAAIYREDPSRARQEISALMERYGTRLRLTRDVLASIADAAVAGTRETFAAAGIALDGLRLTRQLAAALSDRHRPTPPGAGPAADGPESVAVPTAAGAPAAGSSTAAPPSALAGASGPIDASTAGADAVAPAPASASPTPDAAAAAPVVEAPREPRPPVDGPQLAALRDRLAHELEEAAQEAATYDVQRVLLLALEAALRGGPFDRAAFCPIDVASGGFRARFGLGDEADALCTRFALPFTGTGATHGPALLRGQEVHLAQGTRLPIADAHYLRAWGATTSALFPVALESTTIGAVYLDRRATGAVIDATTLVYVRRVVAAAAFALARRRGIAAAPARAEPTGAEKSELVLRVLRGEPLDAVASSAGVGRERLDVWRREFLDGAMARMGG
jgi:HD-like signal output (HDOD) protein